MPRAVEPEASYKGAVKEGMEKKVFATEEGGESGALMLGPPAATRKVAPSADSGVEEGLQRGKDGRVHPNKNEALGHQNPDKKKKNEALGDGEAALAASVVHHVVEDEDVRQVPRLRSTATRRVHPEPVGVDEDILARRACRTWALRLFRFGATRYWVDRVWVCLDSLQLFEILWICSQGWPWPALWLHWTRWIVFVNLDFVGWGDKGAGRGSTGALERSVYGQMPDFLLHLAIPVVGGAVLCAAADVTLRSSAWAERKAHHLDARLGREKYSRLRFRVANVFFRLAACLYAPTCLCLVRLVRCDESKTSRRDGSRLAADPRLACSSLQLFVAHLTVLPLGLAFLVSLPLSAARRAREASCYELPVDHEKHIQRVEMEYVFGVDAGDRAALCYDADDPVQYPAVQADFGQTGRADPEWFAGDVWLVAPFGRARHAQEAFTLWRKLALSLCFLSAFDSIPRTQGLCIFAVVLATAARNLHLPYRSGPTNAIVVILELALVMNATYAMLTSWGLRDAFVMTKQQTYGLMAIAALATLGVVVVGLISVIDEVPAPTRTFARVLNHHGAHAIWTWIDAARSARAAAIKTRAWRPVECAPIDKLEMWAGRLRALWIEAKRCDCIFETTLRESLEEVLLTHELIAPHALVYNHNWLASGDDRLAQAIATLRQRTDDKLLMRPTKRHLLAKLFLSRQFLNASKEHRGLARAVRLYVLVFRNEF